MPPFNTSTASTTSPRGRPTVYALYDCDFRYPLYLVHQTVQIWLQNDEMQLNEDLSEKDEQWLKCKSNLPLPSCCIYWFVVDIGILFDLLNLNESMNFKFLCCGTPARVTLLRDQYLKLVEVNSCSTTSSSNKILRT